MTEMSGERRGERWVGICHMNGVQFTDCSQAELLRDNDNDPDLVDVCNRLIEEGDELPTVGGACGQFIIRLIEA